MKSSKKNAQRLKGKSGHLLISDAGKISLTEFEFIFIPNKYKLLTVIQYYCRLSRENEFYYF